MLLKGSCAVLNCLGCVLPFVSRCTIAHYHKKNVPLSTGFSRQEYWSGVPCPSPGYLTDQGMESASLTSPALAGKFFTTSATREALKSAYKIKKKSMYVFLLHVIRVELSGYKKGCEMLPRN